jgi:hypothetical protein
MIIPIDGFLMLSCINHHRSCWLANVSLERTQSQRDIMSEVGLLRRSAPNR